jgi:hypothetical protein
MAIIPVVDTLNTTRGTDYTPQLGGFTMLPRQFLRHQMQDLSGAELKVMLYIFDHTLGYLDQHGQRKIADAISRSQFLNGIQKADGTIVDRGAGISDRSLDRALDGLVRKGLIFRRHRLDEQGRYFTNRYELNLEGQSHSSQPLPMPPTRQTFSSPAALVTTVATPPQADLHPQNAGGVPAELPPTPPRILRDTKENLQERIKQNTLTPLVPETNKEHTNSVCVASEELPEGKATDKSPQPDPNNSRNPEIGKITTELVQARISKRLAEELAAIAVANGHHQGYVAQVLAYIAEQKQVKSREGLLVHLIKTNWLPTQSPCTGGYALADGGTTTADYQAQLVTMYGEDIVRCLPKAVKPENLPRLLEIEERNLREACSQRERLTAQARLERYRLLGRQLGLLDENAADNQTSSNMSNATTAKGEPSYATIC